MRPPARSPPRLAAAAAALATSAALLLICGTWPASASGFGAYTASSSARRASSTGGADAPPPSFAYLISGTGGEAARVVRLLRAVYHPRNRYLLHLDAAAGAEERAELAAAVRGVRAWRERANVDVVGEGYAVDRAGPSALAAALHGAAVLLRVAADWDWFVTLSSSDYPLVTQDDLLYAFSSVPRDLNFIDHTSDLGWKEHERFEKLIVDPSLYMDRNSEILPATEPRQMPDAFKIFTGSPWVILSRNFTEHCVHGWDNLPRKLLMYFANTAYSMESYFQTVICNSSKFRNTTVNGDLRYFVWDDPPGLEPLVLDESHFDDMVNSSAAFARRFVDDSPVLKKIDKEILNRSSAVCASFSRRRGMDVDSCSKWGDVNVLQPARAGEQLRRFISEISQTRGCS
ncbi:Os04g0301700 [Oryza sativa Japonica Group]|uniref:Os04g0301700 protein n=1 Tax=Oryza sativa subsp. japonica TaxID=39947 RepID=A0A0P0W8A9_ORYSJ|nr:beta-glucuronosyltransferase GlcAT14A [Oryza sativa Japonica Group]BAS88468.1 Os04g0301700 [Oryza sativa Japonica Group]